MNGHPQIVELGPIRPPSTIVLVIALALGIVPLSGAFVGCASIFAQPDRTTLACQRLGDDVRCDQIDWWQDDARWKSEIRARHTAKLATVRYFRTGGKSSKHCVSFETSRVCGGNARANAVALHGLEDGGRVDLDATHSEILALVMAFGSLSGLLFIAWLMWLGVLLGGRTRVKVVVSPTHLAVTKTWAGLSPGRERCLPRVPGESVVVVLYSRGGRGSLPTWQLVYADAQLLAVDALQNPPELEQAAERLRAALAQIPFAAHPWETRS